jgi:predicted ABC-type ATPase
MQNTTQPVVYMIGGPNGAGKTTTALSLLPERLSCYEYVNADAIAAALSPFRVQQVSMQAGRLMLERVHALSEQGESFAFETTMAARSFAPFLKRCKGKGYYIHIIYIWLRTPELAVARVAQRVAQGGHYVDEAVVVDRYFHGLSNFFELYSPIADQWAFFDNTGSEPELVAQLSPGAGIEVLRPELWSKIREISSGTP